MKKRAQCGQRDYILDIGVVYRVSTEFRLVQFWRDAGL
jgi:hypothetical protein